MAAILCKEQQGTVNAKDPKNKDSFPDDCSLFADAVNVSSLDYKQDDEVDCHTNNSPVEHQGSDNETMNVSSDPPIKPILNNSSDGNSNQVAGATEHLYNNPSHLCNHLAELATELLRLQENRDVEPHRTGTFAPEELRRLVSLKDAFDSVPPDSASPFPTTPHRPSKGTVITSPVASLPTPTSTSDGRSEAANLLKARIQRMKDDSEVTSGGLFPSSPAPGGATTVGSAGHNTNENGANRAAETPGKPDYEHLRVKKNEAEAEAALLSAELVALRGRHEEEKRLLQRTTDELRRRNVELESRISEQRLDLMAVSRTSVGGGRGRRVGAAEAPIPNGRSASGSNVYGGEDKDTGGTGSSAFGSRMRAFAQRWSSPPQSAVSNLPTSSTEIRRPSVGSCSSTINTNEDFGQIDFNKGDQNVEMLEQSSICQDDYQNDPKTHSANDTSGKMIAVLEAQLKQSEHRAKVLEQRLQIVKESGDAVIRSLNEELADVAEDRAKAESAMIKELATLDSERRAEREDYERRIQEWIAHDAQRRMEVEEYERRIESLLGTVKYMDQQVDNRSQGTPSGFSISDLGNAAVSRLNSEISSYSWDKEAEKDMRRDLIQYIDSLQAASKGGSRGGNKRESPRVSSINEAFDIEFNANPNVADDMIQYYRSRPELKEFTLKSELPRMDYEVLVVDQTTGEDLKLVTTDQIRSYFASLEEGEIDEEVELLMRAANQSILADPLAMLTGEGMGKLVHSGSFHSTVIATVCSFKLDLRHEGQRRVKVRCELAICVPSGSDGQSGSDASNGENTEEEGKVTEKKSATLELARADLAIQFSPSPTSTPSGPLVKYNLLAIKPTIKNYDDGSENARAIQSAAMALARDRHSQIQHSGRVEGTRPNVKDRFFSRVRALSSGFKDSTLSE